MKRKIAVIGGGMSGLAAAYELTRTPELRDRHEVTLYQLGWRLGGKGASGRGPAGRIEEHGLHLWMGWYENAFQLMRACYRELGRDPTSAPTRAPSQPGDRRRWLPPSARRGPRQPSAGPA